MSAPTTPHHPCCRQRLLVGQRRNLQSNHLMPLQLQRHLCRRLQHRKLRLLFVPTTRGIPKSTSTEFARMADAVTLCDQLRTIATLRTASSATAWRASARTAAIHRNNWLQLLRHIQNILSSIVLRSIILFESVSRLHAAMKSDRTVITARIRTKSMGH
jgi:hypothetical protein